MSSPIWNLYVIYTELQSVLYLTNTWVVNAGKTSFVGIPPAPDSSPPLPTDGVWSISTNGVSQIVAGNNVIVSPVSGLGNVTVSLNPVIAGLTSLQLITLEIDNEGTSAIPGINVVGGDVAVAGNITASGYGTTGNITGVVVNAGTEVITGFSAGTPALTLTNGDIQVGNGNLVVQIGSGSSGKITSQTMEVNGSGYSAGSAVLTVDAGDIKTLSGNIVSSGSVSSAGNICLSGLFVKDGGGSTVYQTTTTPNVAFIGNSVGAAGTGVGIKVNNDTTYNGLQFVNTGVVAITAGTNITTSTATNSLGENTITINAGGGTNPYSYDFWVSPSGNDTTGNGSINAPYATIGKATTIVNAITASTTPVNIHILAGVYASSITTLTRPNVFFIGYGNPTISVALTVNPSTSTYFGGGISNILFTGYSNTFTLGGSCSGYNINNCVITQISLTSVMSSASVISLYGCSTNVAATGQPISFIPSAGSSASVLNIRDCYLTSSTTSNIIYVSSLYGANVLLDDCQITSSTTGASWAQIVYFNNSSSTNAINATILNSIIQYSNTATSNTNKLCIYWSNSQTAGTDSLVIDDCVMVCEGSSTYQYGSSGDYLFMNTSLGGSSTRLNLSLNNVVCGNGLLNTATKTPLQSNKLSKFSLAPSVAPRSAQLYYTSSQALATGNTSFTTGNATTLLIKVVPDIPGDIVVSYTLNVSESVVAAPVINSQMGWYLGTNSSSGSWNTLGSAFGQSFPAGGTALTGNNTGSFIYSLTPTLFQNLGTSSGFDGSITFFVSVWATTGTTLASIIAGSQITAQYNNPQATYS